MKTNQTREESSHVTSAFAFPFDLWRCILENVDVKYEHCHELPFLTSDANTDANIMCEQGFRVKDISNNSLHSKRINVDLINRLQ